jgi:hypothetical protein
MEAVTHNVGFKTVQVRGAAVSAKGKWTRSYSSPVSPTPPIFVSVVTSPMNICHLYSSVTLLHQQIYVTDQSQHNVRFITRQPYTHICCTNKYRLRVPTNIVWIKFINTDEYIWTDEWTPISYSGRDDNESDSGQVRLEQISVRQHIVCGYNFIFVPIPTGKNWYPCLNLLGSPFHM